MTIVADIGKVLPRCTIRYGGERGVLRAMPDLKPIAAKIKEADAILIASNGLVHHRRIAFVCR